MSPSVLFVWRRFPPPFLIGGAEVSQALLAEQLAQAGWSVTYVGSHEPPWGGASKLAEFEDQLSGWSVEYESDPNTSTLAYSWRGVECICTPQAAIESVLRRVVEDSCTALVTSQEGSAELAAIAAHSTPVIGWIHSISATGQEVLRATPRYALLTSRFVQSRVVPSKRTEPILFYPPFAPPSQQPVKRTRDVLMINPVPAKGGALVRELAASRPDQTFTLVEGWWNAHDDFKDLVNVVYVPRTYEMESLYASHRLLLVPSVVEDAFPRVIVEGALVGLPALGAAVGGIEEAIGPGGLVHASRSAQEWASAIDALIQPHAHKLYGGAAREHAKQFVRDCADELSQAGVI